MIGSDDHDLDVVLVGQRRPLITPGMDEGNDVDGDRGSALGVTIGAGEGEEAVDGPRQARHLVERVSEVFA
jgi:hypothetical protein